MIEQEERPAVNAPSAPRDKGADSAPAMVERPAGPPNNLYKSLRMGPRPVWRPPSSVSNRAVESVVILATMVYFVSAALPALGLV